MLTSRCQEWEWRSAVTRYRERLAPFVTDRVARTGTGRKHPVYDFLFEYYSLRPAHLLRWSPGIGIFLEGATFESFPGASALKQRANGLVLEAADYPAQRLESARWTARYLERIRDRAPELRCYGLHEWAMVYRTDEIRHRQVKLRLHPDEIAHTVDSMGLRCSHFDAYRFFTSRAVPLNRCVLARETTPDHDQPGCIHVTMDLYRYAYKLGAFCPADLLADAFELAANAREIDMRASPYDLAELGFAPIRIETAAGREEYMRHQCELMAPAGALRARLIDVYRGIVGAN